MKNHHEVEHFRNRLMIVLLSLIVLVVTAGQSFAATDCSSCHGMPPLDSAERSPTSGSFKGSHQIHLGDPAAAADCVSCHGPAAATYDMSHSASPRNVIKMATGIYSKGNSFDQTPTPLMGKCTNASCHAEVYSEAPKDSPDWGTPGNGCSTCHTTPIGVNGPATGSHTAHAGKACIECHAAGTTATTFPSVSNGHTDGNIDIFNVGYPADVAKHAAVPGTYGTCSTARCHNNGRGTYTPVTWGSTNSVGCALCHPSLSGKHSSHTNLSNAAYGNTADNSTNGSYDFGCGNCHPIDIDKHLDTFVDITLNSTHGGALKAKNNAVTDNSGYVRNPGVSVTCAAAYCHSNGMAVPTYYGADVDWYEASYTGDKCARCHGNSPNSGGKIGSAAHGAHLVGIHFENIYNGVSGKLYKSGGATVNAAHGRNNRSTTINCNICHAMTVTTFANDENSACSGCHKGPAGPKGVASINDKSKHVNGSVEVSFIDQPIATKAQVGNSAFAAYTANTSGWARNSNGMPYKTYTSSYDYTKSTLSAGASPYTQADGCLNIACHSSIPIKWTATNVSCQNCHTRLK